MIKKMIPKKFVNMYHFFLSILGAIIYRFPSRKIKVIGITGTAGKTTVADYTAKILETAGYDVALLSSIKFKIKEHEEENRLKMTMPGRFFIQKFLRRAVRMGCKYMVIEVTSEGIKQHRHKFINFDVVVFTNLSLEHIEAHGSFEKYREAKLSLFKENKKIHIINGDDKNSSHFIEISSEKKIIFGKNGIKADNVIETEEGLVFKIKDVEFKLSAFGKFNAHNALAAACVGLSQNVSLETSSKALRKVSTSGRMEVISDSPLVIVDYAHTPTELQAAYEALIALKRNKIICVLGSCGGGRDKWKRQVLGEISLKYCDEIIITNEDPYDEDPLEIIRQVALGAGNKAEKILDRKKAIKRAVSLAKENDIVIITGKGSEPWMCLAKGKKEAWDDRKIAREALKNR